MDERGLVELALTQHGLVTAAQARRCGLDASAVHRRVRSGRWRTVRRGVYAIGAAPPGWEQEVHAAVLAVGTVGVLTLTDRADAGPSAAVDASQASPSRSSFDGDPGRHGREHGVGQPADRQQDDDSGWVPSQPDAGTTWRPDDGFGGGNGGDSSGAFGGGNSGAFGGGNSGAFDNDNSGAFGGGMSGSLGGSRSGAS